MLDLFSGVKRNVTSQKKRHVRKAFKDRLAFRPPLATAPVQRADGGGVERDRDDADAHEERQEGQRELQHRRGRCREAGAGDSGSRGPRIVHCPFVLVEL